MTLSAETWRQGRRRWECARGMPRLERRKPRWSCSDVGTKDALPAQSVLRENLAYGDRAGQRKVRLGARYNLIPTVLYAIEFIGLARAVMV